MKMYLYCSRVDLAMRVGGDSAQNNPTPALEHAQTLSGFISLDSGFYQFK